MNDAIDSLPYEREVNVLGRYVLTHPNWRRAFLDHQPSDVINTLLRHLKRGTIRVAQNEDKEIIGLMLFTPNTAEQFITVNVLLGSDPRIIDCALAAWALEYPGFSLSVQRHGKNRVYRFNQFFQTK